MNIVTPVFTSEHAHAGHSHGWLGELVEHATELLPFSEQLKDCINHIIVDSLTVFFMLFAVMMLVFFLTSYINTDKLHKKLNSLNSIWGFLLALVLGILSPFCSCSIIPLLMGFLSVGVPVSVCLCFLTASSMINLTALLSLSATQGVKFTLIYILCAVTIIILSSVILSFLKLDNSISSYHAHHHKGEAAPKAFVEKLKSAFSCTVDVFKRSVIFILIGVILSSVIMSYFSIDTIAQFVNENSVISTAIVNIMGIPLHSDIFSIAPILTLLYAISPSIAITFAISTMAISLPSIVILSRALRVKTVAIYCGVITGLTIITGYILMLCF